MRVPDAPVAGAGGGPQHNGAVILVLGQGADLLGLPGEPQIWRLRRSAMTGAGRLLSRRCDAGELPGDAREQSCPNDQWVRAAAPVGLLDEQASEAGIGRVGERFRCPSYWRPWPRL